jgi:hypothetical protein
MDPTTFFIDFKEAKKVYFLFIFFLQANYLQSKKFNFLLKFSVKTYLSHTGGLCELLVQFKYGINIQILKESDE